MPKDKDFLENAFEIEAQEQERGDSFGIASSRSMGSQSPSFVAMKDKGEPASAYESVGGITSLSKDYLDQMRAASASFRDIDHDDNGTFTPVDLQMRMATIGIYEDDSTVALMFRAIDKDRSGRISEAEFCKWLLEEKPVSMNMAMNDIWTIAFAATFFYFLGGMLYFARKIYDDYHNPPDVVDFLYVWSWLAQLSYTIGGTLFFALPLAVVKNKHRSMERGLTNFRSKLKQRQQKLKLEKLASNDAGMDRT